jgi:hypothetical protein
MIFWRVAEALRQITPSKKSYKAPMTMFGRQDIILYLINCAQAIKNSAH